MPVDMKFLNEYDDYLDIINKIEGIRLEDFAQFLCKALSIDDRLYKVIVDCETNPNYKRVILKDGFKGNVKIELSIFDEPYATITDRMNYMIIPGEDIKNPEVDVSLDLNEEILELLKEKFGLVKMADKEESNKASQQTKQEEGKKKVIDPNENHIYDITGEELVDYILERCAQTFDEVCEKRFLDWDYGKGKLYDMSSYLAITGFNKNDKPKVKRTKKVVIKNEQKEGNKEENCGGGYLPEQ